MRSISKQLYSRVKMVRVALGTSLILTASVLMYTRGQRLPGGLLQIIGQSWLEENFFFYLLLPIWFSVVLLSQRAIPARVASQLGQAEQVKKLLRRQLFRLLIGVLLGELVALLVSGSYLVRLGNRVATADWNSLLVLIIGQGWLFLTGYFLLTIKNMARTNLVLVLVELVLLLGIIISSQVLPCNYGFKGLMLLQQKNGLSLMLSGLNLGLLALTWGLVEVWSSWQLMVNDFWRS